MSRTTPLLPSSDAGAGQGGGGAFSRRGFLHGAAGACLIARMTGAADAAGLASEDPVEAAFLHAFPVFEIARTRFAATARARAMGLPGVNILGHRPVLSDHRDRGVTTPNADTLYSAAWLDLSHGPVALSMPKSWPRYASAQLLDAFGDTVAVHGSGTASEGTQLFIVGPGWEGTVPAGGTLVRAPRVDLWLIVRVFVADAGDLAEARKVQQAFALTSVPAAHTPFIAQPDDGSDPAVFLAVVNEALGRAPLPAVRARGLVGLAAAGLVPGRSDAWESLPEPLRREWHARLPALREGLREGLQQVGTKSAGWSYPDPRIGTAEADARVRSLVALGGLGALPAEEAVYISARADAAGRALEGSARYRLRIPGQVPMRAFWSLSLYEIDPLGRLFFTENAIGRHAISDRTAGLEREADGSWVVAIAHERPARPSNWLPVPAGPFALTLRIYRPGPEIRDGRFRMPGVERL